jgi:hypothetical protein
MVGKGYHGHRREHAINARKNRPNLSARQEHLILSKISNWTDLDTLYSYYAPATIIKILRRLGDKIEWRTQYVDDGIGRRHPTKEVRRR